MVIPAPWTRRTHPTNHDGGRRWRICGGIVEEIDQDTLDEHGIGVTSSKTLLRAQGVQTCHRARLQNRIELRLRPQPLVIFQVRGASRPRNALGLAVAASLDNSDVQGHAGSRWPIGLPAALMADERLTPAHANRIRLVENQVGAFE